MVCYVLLCNNDFLQGGRIGVFTKDNFTGDFVEGWKKVLEDTNLEMVSYITNRHAYLSTLST